MCPANLNDTLELVDAGPGRSLLPRTHDEDVPYFPGQLAITSHSTFCGSNWTRGNPFCAVGSPSAGDDRLGDIAKGRVIMPDMIDYSILRSWISSCKDEHLGCRNPASIPLKLINCRTRTIESFQSHVPYAALSYVWGNLTPPGQAMDHGKMNRTLPARLPLTIEDAIKVSVGLGYQHLWIDRYCISQHDGDEKAREIRRMDEIYQGAEVVIIDTAGDDPSVGLAGVSRRRNTQPRVSTGTHTLVSLLSYPINNIRSSKWATRGWTYQEAVLAKRRLFFTMDQVYFECHVHGYMETFCESLVHRDVAGPSVATNDPRRDRRNPSILCRYLEEYSKRELRYPSDALNAFLGVLRVSESAEDNPIPHYWGVPISRSLTESPEHDCCALEGFISGLCWSSSETMTTRRTQFPSWSWAGWDCSGAGITYHHPETVFHSALTSLRISHGFQVLTWPEVWTRCRDEGLAATFCTKAWPSRMYAKGRVIEFEASRGPTDCNSCSGFNDVYFPQKRKNSRRRGKTIHGPSIRAYLQQVPEGMEEYTALVIGRSSDARGQDNIGNHDNEGEGNVSTPI